MTSQSLQTITTNSKYKNYVPPVNEFQLGRQLFRKGFFPHSDWSERMRDGWDTEGRQSYQQAMLEDGE